MRLIGLMCVRNEDWILDLSLHAALQWCDSLMIVDHSSWDRTKEIVQKAQADHPWRIHYSRWEDSGEWDEMEMRQHSLEAGRKYRGTHFAMIDADEVPTANVIDRLRNWVVALGPGQAFELPMIPIWKELGFWRNDGSVWSKAWLSLAFRDRDDLFWRRAADGYEHHHRLPYGIEKEIVRPQGFAHADGGVMHLQFVNRRRLLAKHVLYRMADHLRWPERDGVQQLNAKYDQALTEQGMRVYPCPLEWWGSYDRQNICLDGTPWQENAIRKLLQEHGREAFAGLDLKGF